MTDTSRMGVSGVGFSVTSWQRVVVVAARGTASGSGLASLNASGEPGSVRYSERDREVLHILHNVFGMRDQSRTFGFVTKSSQQAVLTQEWKRVISITTSAAKEAAVQVTQRGQDLIAARFGHPPTIDVKA